MCIQAQWTYLGAALYRNTTGHPIRLPASSVGLAASVYGAFVFEHVRGFPSLSHMFVVLSVCNVLNFAMFVLSV